MKKKSKKKLDGPRNLAERKVLAERVLAESKAMAIERITRSLLRTSKENLVLEVATSLMGMPDRTVVTCLRALDNISPDALSTESKTKRLLDCTKLAVRLVGDESSDKTIENLSATFMTIDDPTLKSILKQVAAAARPETEEWV